MFNRLAIVALRSCICLVFQGCALLQPPPQDLVTKGDHAGIANYYQEQAHELREKAKKWDALAESYERHGNRYGKLEVEQDAAYCRAVAASNRKAADEADALAISHQRQLPQGVTQ
jgi:hypothetical protein